MPMLDPAHPLSKLLQRDKRYKFEAYAFVFESLNFAQEKMGLGQEAPTEEEETEPEPKRKEESAKKRKEESGMDFQVRNMKKTERHMTGQQLCEAIRQYALEQFGLMAKAVLNSWGVHSTGDIGNIVFNLIEIGQMRKTKQDTREDFENVFDFDAALVRDFKITAVSQSQAEES
jgi:uncharacterized repeat protein (TIGR04138 family)